MDSWGVARCIACLGSVEGIHKTVNDEDTLPPLRSPDDRAGRVILRAIILWVLLFIAIVVGFLIPGCATERFLTEEQDAAMRSQCLPAGCRVVPLPAWRQIEQFIRQFLPDPQHKEG